MDVHRQAEASGFAGNIAEKEVLQPGVIVRRRNVAFDEVRINLLNRLKRLGRSKVERTQISRLKFDGHSAILLLYFKHGRNDFRDVVLERWRQCVAVNVFKVAAQQHGLTLEEKLAVRRLTSQAGIFQ